MMNCGFIDSGNSSPPVCVSNKLDVIDCLQVLDGHFTAPLLTSLSLLTGDLSTVKSHITDRISMGASRDLEGETMVLHFFFPTFHYCLILSIIIIPFLSL